MRDQLLTIGQLAQRTGVAPSALRYYEELGLVAPALRVSGQRRYDTSAIGLVGVIVFLRDVGFSLAETTVLMASRRKSADAWRELARQKLAGLEKRIEQAHAARAALEHALRCKHGDILDCPNFAGVLAARLAGKPLAQAHHH
jgi:DNA-binding transcriptional MerR regulator